MKMRAALAAALLWPAAAYADCGALRLRQEAGPFTVSVFTTPEPLRAGPADVSVLVQDRATHEVLLEAEVTLVLRGPDGAQVMLPASRAQARNKLLQAAALDLPLPGAWTLSVTVRRGLEEATVACDIPVEPAAPPLRAVWPLLALPPAAIVLFALNQRLRRRKQYHASSCGACS